MKIEKKKAKEDAVRKAAEEKVKAAQKAKEQQ
jgi:hypothetical protein